MASSEDNSNILPNKIHLEDNSMSSINNFSNIIDNNITDNIINTSSGSLDTTTCTSTITIRSGICSPPPPAGPIGLLVTGTGSSDNSQRTLPTFTSTITTAPIDTDCTKLPEVEKLLDLDDFDKLAIFDDVDDHHIKDIKKNHHNHQNGFGVIELNIEEIDKEDILDLIDTISGNILNGSGGGGGGNNSITSNIGIKSNLSGGGGQGIERNIGNMFSDVFDSNVGDALEEETLEESCQFSDGPEKNCMICKGSLNSPRILSCLHVFCETCLDNLLIDETGDTSKTDCVIVCPTCEQTTKVGPKGAASLTCDYIYTNILDLSTIEPKMLACTSCKSKENAISRCNDCANFLCAGCDNAHKYMRCFENHEVAKLEDLQKSNEKVTIHKPLFCAVHTSENLKYYCFNCQIPVCNDCLIADHKGSEHHYDLLSTAEKCVRTDVNNLIKDARSKVQYCDSAAQDLSTALTELQTQHDTARDLIEEAYRNFKSIIDKCRDKSLKDLEKLHSERELKIMDLLHVVEKTIEKIDGVCKFTNRVLDQGNAAEFLSMKKLIHAQFVNLISNTPKCDISYSLEFDTKFDKFEQLATDVFGKFRTESTPPSPKESTPPPTLPGMPPALINHHRQQHGGIGGNMNNSQSALTNNGSSVTASSPISLPTSMQSSFDGDLSALGNNFMLPSNVLQTPESPPQHHLHHNHNQQHHVLHNGNQHHINGGTGNLQQQHHLLNGGGANGNGNVNGIVSNGINNTGNSVVPSGGGNNMNSNGIGGFNSIAEYNLQRLANLAENTPDLADTLGATGGSTSGGTNQHITLADILAGDQRALTNFHALAKLGLNSNVDDFHTDLTANHHHNQQHHNLLNGVAGIRGTSPGGIDSLLNDFGLGGSSTSPMPSLSVLGGGGAGGNSTDDLGITNFSSIGVPGRTKATPMQIRCKFGSLGTSKAQFNSPHGFCLGVDEEIIVADTNNHRIEVFEKNGAFKFQFGVPGKEEGQLWYPRKVAVMLTNGKFVVCDRGNERSRMQIFSKNGHFMKKIAIRYIDIVAGLAVTSKGQIVAVDSVSPTVFIISEDGDLVHWFDCSDYMREPSDIAIRDNDFYVCDFKGHCVAVFKDDGTFQYRIGNEKVTCFPNGIDISNAGDILIGDSHGNRFHVACYSREGVLQSEFECPHVKVSRCCGLKITSEGYVVTLAKNNHHVLVLNTLYVQ